MAKKVNITQPHIRPPHKNAIKVSILRKRIRKGDIRIIGVKGNCIKGKDLVRGSVTTNVADVKPANRKLANKGIQKMQRAVSSHRKGERDVYAIVEVNE